MSMRIGGAYMGIDHDLKVEFIRTLGIAPWTSGAPTFLKSLRIRTLGPWGCGVKACEAGPRDVVTLSGY